MAKARFGTNKFKIVKGNIMFNQRNGIRTIPGVVFIDKDFKKKAKKAKKP